MFQNPREAFLAVVQNRTELRYSNYTIHGPRSDDPATIDGIAGGFTSGQYSLIGLNPRVRVSRLRQLVVNSRVSTGIKREYVERLARAQISKPDLTRMRQIWRSRALAEGLPEVVLLLGTIQRNSLEIATLYCAPSAPPEEELARLQVAALRVMAQNQGGSN